MADRSRADPPPGSSGVEDGASESKGSVERDGGADEASAVPPSPSTHHSADVAEYAGATLDDADAQVLSDGANVEVVVRIRPLLPFEEAHGSELLEADPGSGTVFLHPTKKGSGTTSKKEFSFDAVFGPTATQQDVFHGVRLEAKVLAVLRGYNATVFAYGQTGAGKTFTMEGYAYETVSRGARGVLEQRAKPRAHFNDTEVARLGLVPRTVEALFGTMSALRAGTIAGASAAKLRRREYKVKCSFLQIYNEQVYDLFNATHLRAFGAGTGGSRAGSAESNLGPGLRVRWSADSDFYVENLFMHECSSAEEMVAHFHAGLRRKIMAAHKLNAASSRSHCVFSVHVEAVDPARPSETITSRLSLVDLAGSERLARTRTRGQTMQESIGINKSLFMLRKVITSLAAPPGSAARRHIPYRDSKLTALLKHSLGGNSITLMVACLSPSDAYYDENLSTLTYASTTSCIQNRPEVNADPKTRLIARLRAEIALLKRQLMQAQAVAAVALGSDEAQESSRTKSRGRGGEAPRRERRPNRPSSPITPARGSAAAAGDSVAQSRSPLVRRSRPKRSGDGAPSQKAIKEEVKKIKAAMEKKATAAQDLARRAQSRANAARKTAAKAKAEVAAREKKIKELAAAADSTTEASTALKRDMISNVDLIKSMFAVERQLRAQLDDEAKAKTKAEEDNLSLNLENQNLRERVEILEYLLRDHERSEKKGATATASRAESSRSATPAGSSRGSETGEVVIPEYGVVEEHDFSSEDEQSRRPKGGRPPRRSGKGGRRGKDAGAQWATPVGSASAAVGHSRSRKARAASAGRSRAGGAADVVMVGGGGAWDVSAGKRRGPPSARSSGSGDAREPRGLSVEELRGVVRGGSSRRARGESGGGGAGAGMMAFPNAYTPSDGFKAAGGGGSRRPRRKNGRGAAMRDDFDDDTWERVDSREFDESERADERRIAHPTPPRGSTDHEELVRAGTVGLSRLSTTGRVLSGEPEAAGRFGLEASGGSFTPISRPASQGSAGLAPPDPLSAMAELNELMLARAKLRSSSQRNMPFRG